MGTLVLLLSHLLACVCVCGGVSGRVGSGEGLELMGIAQENEFIDCLITTIYLEVKITVE